MSALWISAPGAARNEAALLRHRMRTLVHELGQFLSEHPGNAGLRLRAAQLRLMFAVARERTVSVQEAAWLLTGHTLAYSSRDFVWLDARPNRGGMVMRRGHLEQQPADSTIIFYDSWLDLYWDRPPNLERLTLAGFCRFYRRAGRPPATTRNAARHDSNRIGAWSNFVPGGLVDTPEADNEEDENEEEASAANRLANQNSGAAESDLDLLAYGMRLADLPRRITLIGAAGTSAQTHSGTRTLLRRSRPAVIRTPRIDPLREPDVFYGELLSLHVPHR